MKLFPTPMGIDVGDSFAERIEGFEVSGHSGGRAGGKEFAVLICPLDVALIVDRTAGGRWD